MVTLQSVQRRTGLTHHFSDIRALWCSVLSARVPECQKIKKCGLDQCGPEHFGRLIFATIRKSVGLKGLTTLTTLVRETVITVWLLSVIMTSNTVITCEMKLF